MKVAHFYNHDLAAQLIFGGMKLLQFHTETEHAHPGWSLEGWIMKESEIKTIEWLVSDIFSNVNFCSYYIVVSRKTIWIMKEKRNISSWNWNISKKKSNVAWQVYCDYEWALTKPALLIRGFFTADSKSHPNLCLFLSPPPMPIICLQLK